MPDQTRSDEQGTVGGLRTPIEDSVTLDVPPELVWRALTDAEELTRWFPFAATVQPGVGGSVALSWGQGFEKAVIEVWEPDRRLRTVERRRDSAGRVVEIAVDFLIQSEGGKTVLRVVHSGFGASTGWNEEYDGTVRGWRYELRGLRHYLASHVGTNRRVAIAETPTSLSPEASYER
ncbi:MAG TPA: SRPBCC domain-containing protein, partial [Gemmatimonadales bacterium]|nr:SRPBCC domain-containing protein [Gemmatimonadales bacterium]